MSSRDEFEKLFPKAKDLSFSEPENAYLDADEHGMCISWNMTAHWEAWQASREQMKKEIKDDLKNNIMLLTEKNEFDKGFNFGILAAIMMIEELE